MSFLGNVSTRIQFDFQHVKRYFLPKTSLVATVLIIAIPLGYISDITAGSASNYDTLLARLFTAGMFFLTLQYNQRDNPNKEIQAYLVIFSILIASVAWTSFVMYGAALSDPENPTPMLYWVIQTLVGAYVLSHFCGGVVLAMIIFYSAGVISSLGLLLIDTPNMDMVFSYYYYLLPLYTAVIYLTHVSSRNTWLAREEGLRAATSISSTIAHELRTPLSGIGARAKSMSDASGALIRTYQERVSSGSNKHIIPKSELDRMRAAFTEIENQSNRAATLIQMLLLNINQTPIKSTDQTAIQASSLVSDALEQYPYLSPDENFRVSAKVDGDFEINGPSELLKHVLFQLIKNSLKAVNSVPGGTVEIIVYPDRFIDVKDNGPGIRRELWGKVFEPSFTTRSPEKSLGNGLAFCNRVLTSIDGSIELCHTPTGALFRLRFPRLN